MIFLNLSISTLQKVVILEIDKKNNLFFLPVSDVALELHAAIGDGPRYFKPRSSDDFLNRIFYLEVLKRK